MSEVETGKILIVEDQEPIRKPLIGHLLDQGVKKTDIYQATNRLEALELIREVPFAIVLLDCSLDPNDHSNMDGLQVRRVIKESSLQSEAHVFDISSNGQIPEADPMNVKTGAMDYKNAAKQIIEVRETLNPIRTQNV